MRNLIMTVEGLPHCPRNRSHTIIKKGKGSFLGKTEAARAYERALKHHLAKYKEAAAKFLQEFDKETSHLVAYWEFHSPEVKTVTGRYSQTAGDLDCHKVLQDTIMEFVGIDDGFIVKDERVKLQGDYKVICLLRIKDNNGADLL